MKYIRTKDGHIVDTSIYKKVVARNFTGRVVAIDLSPLGQNSDKESIFIFVKDIVKQADDIKDLCDDFIIDVNYKDKPYLYNRDEPVDSPEFDDEDEVVYGAIWTRGVHGEPILKPVAKLNDKGKFELL